jgi:putative transposase
VALSFLFLLMRRALEMSLIRRKSSFDKDVEILVLRHQLEILRRKTTRSRFSWADRAFLSLTARLLPRQRWSSLLVTPATILEWQRRIVRRRWTFPKSAGAPTAR